ncbi:hypothetical protein B0H19DRAFT_1094896 [Mycena capillaripes]|nr:hypothetical protein B0H19DRAFT_1094896 [Mycena capillaripes]
MTMQVGFSWSDTSNFPLYAGAASGVILFAHLLWTLKLRVATLKSSPQESLEVPSIVLASGRVAQHGGNTIFAFKVARFVGCLGLLGCSIISLVLDNEGSHESSKLAPAMLHVAMCVLYVYISILAALSVSRNVKWSQIAIRHLSVLLLCTFGVYFYRDVFPLATFPLVPMDLSEGPLLWAKIVILFIVSSVIPVAIPRQYKPVDPKNPMPTPNPEQTASILSSVMYSFLDPIIFLGYRTPHLEVDQLPPLSDYDYAETLKTKAFRHLEGKPRHIFFGLIWVFRWECLTMSVLIVTMASVAFISPIGINRLLNYLENPNEESFMKPWFWILLLFLGPFLVSLSFQRYLFVAARVVCQVNAIVRQLVYEHALRIRVKAEPLAGKTKSGAKTPASNLLGKITNLITTDLSHIGAARNVQIALILVPIQIIGSVVFLYKVLGWSAFVGMSVMVAMFPLPGRVLKMAQRVQKLKLKQTDARVQTVSETVNLLRMIKMFGWESQMDKMIAEKREEELNFIWQRKLLDLLNTTLNLFIPIATMLATYGQFPTRMFKKTVIMKQDLSASKVFSSIAIFDMLRTKISFTVLTISWAVNSRILAAVYRLNDFLHNTELLDSFTSQDAAENVSPEQSDNVTGFRDATFAWSNDGTDGTLASSNGKFLLKIEGEVLFKEGCVNLVIGPTGSGKTSLLMALLGEMHLVPSSASWFSLPRRKGVSYAAQESWVLNDTVRNNILFNTPVDEERYKKVIYQCCLERDLELWDAGDETEIGEKGLTLSGGQKARVTLARAIYADTQVILLDDVLSALDVHTAKWIVEKCLRGDLVNDRTVILVTHNVRLASPIAEFVVSIGLDGYVRGRNSISEALAKDSVLANEADKDDKMQETVDQVIDTSASPAKTKKASGKLILAEEVAVGNVSRSALSLYFRGLGGNHTRLFFSVFILGLVSAEVANSSRTWYLGFWASQYGHGTPVAVFHYLGIFCALMGGWLGIYALSFIFYNLGAFRASIFLHKKLIGSILGTTFRWLDVTPTSRIIARCTVDIGAVDGPIALGLWTLLELSISMLIKFSAVILFTPLFFFVGAFVGILGAWCGQVYLASQRSVKREMSIATAPVIGHFGTTIAGLTSVRAYGAQNTVIQKSFNRINRLSRVARINANLTWWIVVRIDALGAIFAASLAYYLVYFQGQRSENIGFSLNMAFGFSNTILNWVRALNEFQVQGNSLERLQQYSTIEQEPKPTVTGIPPAYWPASGSIDVDNLSAKYAPEGPTVLHNISFNIQSGERVGVVGRTGSGKSSLTLSLLRCIFTEGTVYYDGISTASLNLDVLRSNMTIIPQFPELFSGSIRTNLDIFGQFDDATLNSALSAAGLSSLQDEMTEGKLTLDNAASGLSQGQRQIIALARAIVRGSKLLILDEDYKTDAVIQSSLRKLSSETTQIIVAHRLQSIMDADKIMVLDAGRIVEFGRPKVLLESKDGMLRALVDESGDKEILYKMAQV